MTYKELQKLDKEYGTPFYIFDQKAFIENYHDIVKAFKSRYPKFILAYSYKANYVPYLLKIIKNLGGFAEVVSRLEYDLALKVGQKGDKIIFNGPVKSREDIETALNNKAIVNCDSMTGIDFVKQYASKNPKKLIKIGLRINIALSGNHIQGKIPVSRFGFDRGDLSELIKSLAAFKNIRISGLHGHTSTIDRSLICFQIITETLCDIAEHFFPDSIEYINVGGGIFGKIPPEMRWIETPSFNDYAKTITAVLKKYAWVRTKKPYLVLEPGVAMAANAVSFVTKIVSKKQIHRRLFVTVDGSAFNVKPSFHHINQPYKIIKNRPSSSKETYNVVGSTCMEKDRLLESITDKPLERSDFLIIENCGAYTIVLTPPFINPAPPILVKGKNRFKLIRKRQTLKEIFNNYLF